MTDITPPSVDHIPRDFSQAHEHRSSRIHSANQRFSAGPKWFAALSGPVIYLAVAFALTADSWSNPAHTVIGEGGDPISFLWALQWPAFAIGHGLNPFFTHYLIAPQGTNLMWTGSSGPGILLAPLVFLLGPAVVYNLMAAGSLAISAWLAELAIHRLVPSWPGAIVGGLVFGFSPYMMGHAYGHVTITMAFLPPLILILLHETLIRQRWRWWATGAFAGLLLAIQVITFLETIAITFVGAAIVTVLLAVQRWHEIRPRLAYAIKVCAAVGVTFLAAAAYPLSTMLFGPERLGSGTVQPPDLLVTDIVNFLVPSVTTRFIPSVLNSTAIRVTNGVESGGYIGIALLAICIMTAIVLWRNIVVRTAALTGLILAILSLGPRLHVDGTVLTVPLPFAIFAHLPLVDNILAARLMGIVDLCVGVLVAAYVAHLGNVRAPWRALGVFLLGFGLFLIVPAPLPLPNEPYTVPSYFTSRAVKQIPAGSTALVAPFDSDGTDDNPQIWQAASGFRFKMPEGYVYVQTSSGPTTGPIPVPLSEQMGLIFIATATSPAPALTPADRVVFLAQLSEWHITTVVVGPMPNYNLMVSFFKNLLGRPGRYQGGVTAWYHVQS
jgi:hypothetical protein